MTPIIIQLNLILANGYLPRVSRQTRPANGNGDTGAMHRSPGISGKPQLGDRS